MISLISPSHDFDGQGFPGLSLRAAQSTVWSVTWKSSVHLCLTSWKHHLSSRVRGCEFKMLNRLKKRKKKKNSMNYWLDDNGGTLAVAAGCRPHGCHHQSWKQERTKMQLLLLRVQCFAEKSLREVGPALGCRTTCGLDSSYEAKALSIG